MPTPPGEQGEGVKSRHLMITVCGVPFNAHMAIGLWECMESGSQHGGCCEYKADTVATKGSTGYFSTMPSPVRNLFMVRSFGCLHETGEVSRED